MVSEYLLLRRVSPGEPETRSPQPPQTPRTESRTRAVFVSPQCTMKGRECRVSTAATCSDRGRPLGSTPSDACQPATCSQTNLLRHLENCSDFTQDDLDKQAASHSLALATKGQNINDEHLYPSLHVTV
ncbi:hypothetical protein RR48_10296 [Papilio machaon]|uniref:Uncharacterized protein n=1 Tax=Papilio machaon TaxID=76193 RepID=A0A194RGI3_PAPMA|nr:hypothetical protein RR48_10296 [Papilio machaon]